MTRLRSRGAAMVELAIVLPLLLVIFIGLAELGRALLLQHILVRHVETGARYLGRSYQTLNADCSETPAWTAAASAAADLVVYGNEAGSGTALIGGMSAGDVSIPAPTARAVPGYGNACVVQVAANVAYPSLFGATIPLLGLPQPRLQAASEERYVGE